MALRSEDRCSKVSSKANTLKSVRCYWYAFEAVVSRAHVTSALTPPCPAPNHHL